MRLFVSVDLDDLTEEVARVQELVSGASGVRLTDPAQAHVTLKFLGETDPERLEPLTAELRRAIEGSGVEPFRASFGGLGVFPGLEYISVVWFGVREGSEQFVALQEPIERRITAMGFDPEDHEFTPHVTIARMDHAGGKELVQSAVEDRDPDVGELLVDQVRLTESVLTPDGPEYTTVETFDLG
jgi:2'-5' RNA ligase